MNGLEWYQVKNNQEKGQQPKPEAGSYVKPNQLLERRLMSNNTILVESRNFKPVHQTFKLSCLGQQMGWTQSVSDIL
jgi:hypothetical protein